MYPLKVIQQMIHHQLILNPPHSKKPYQAPIPKDGSQPCNPSYFPLQDTKPCALFEGQQTANALEPNGYSKSRTQTMQIHDSKLALSQKDSLKSPALTTTKPSHLSSKRPLSEFFSLLLSIYISTSIVSMSKLPFSMAPSEKKFISNKYPLSSTLSKSCLSAQQSPVWPQTSSSRMVH